MASMGEHMKCLFFLQLLVACVPQCTGLEDGGVFVDRPDANVFLRRGKRANYLLEELKRGNVERECYEEKCSYEEAREIFTVKQQLDTFWRLYISVDQCLASPCKNGATCTRHFETYSCKCSPAFHGFNCDKARVTASSHGCGYKNGGCEHFCRTLPDRSAGCFCAEGYRLDHDNSSCLPQVPVVCGRQLNFFSPRVVKGKICPKGQCPWQALITENQVYKCGAIVVSDQWILTAAHCVYRKTLSALQIIVGEHNRNVKEDTEQKRRVAKLLIHQNYNYTTSDNDIALLKLQRPITLNQWVVPICLAAKNSSFSRTLAAVRHSTVSGWGRLAQHGPPSVLLQRLVLPRVPQQECRLHTKLNITRNMICAGVRAGGQDACEGDSGGPLITRYKKTWFLTGVVSWGKGCAQANMYGVYTKVANYLQWISDMMKNE